MADQGTQAPNLTIGTDPWSAAIGLVDTGLSYLGQSETNRMQREMHDDEMRLNQQEFEASRSDQMDQARINREFNHDEAQIAREYESLPEQLKRSRSMGVSDWAALGQPGQMASASSQSGVSPAFPGMPGIPQLQNPFSTGNFAGNVKSLADSLKSVKEAEKYGADTEALYKTLGLDIANKQADLEAKQIANALAYTWGHLKNAADLKESFARTASLYKQADLFAKQGDLAEAEARLADARKSVEDVTKQLRENERDIAKKELDTFEEQKRHEWKQMDSESAVNYATAQLNREMATRVHDLLPGEKEQQQLSSKLMKAETQLTWEQIRTEPDKRRLMAQQCVQMYEETKGIRMDNEQKRIYTDKFEDIVNTALHADKAALKQIIQDFNNPFRYIGHVFGGSGAAAVNAAAGHRPGPVRVAGFRP